MRRNTKGKRISSLPLVNRNGWNVEYQVWDSLKTKQNKIKQQKERKNLNKLKRNNNKKQLYFSFPFSSLFLPSFDQQTFFILFPPVFSLSPCFGIISAFLALAYFQVLLSHLLGSAAVSTSYYPHDLLIATVSCTLSHSPHTYTITCKCGNSLVGGEEKKKKGMWCNACRCPFPAYFPSHASLSSLDGMGEGLKWGLGPMLQWCFDSFLLHSPTSFACLAGYSLAECPIGLSALHGGKCFIWLFHSGVDHVMERYTICQRPQLLKALWERAGFWGIHIICNPELFFLPFTSHPLLFHLCS